MARIENRFKETKEINGVKFFMYEEKDNFDAPGTGFKPREMQYDAEISKTVEGMTATAYLRDGKCIVIVAGDNLIFGGAANEAYTLYFSK